MEALTYPWEVQPTSQKWMWHIGYLSTTLPNVSSVIQFVPPESRQEQIRCLSTYAMGTRNWIVCLCQSSRYMMELYPYVTSTFTFNTNKRSAIVDIQQILDAIYDKDEIVLERVETVDLLVIPCADAGHFGLRTARAKIASLLTRRKSKRLSTIVDVLVERLPTGKQQMTSHVQTLKGVYGNLGWDLFNGDHAKWVSVRMREGGGNARNIEQ